MTIPNREDSASIGENTMVRLGMVLGFLMTFGWAVWWASGVQSDLNTIKIQMSHFSQIESLDTRLKILETVGSPAVRDLQKELENLRKDFELHKAVTIKGNPP